MRKLKVNDFFCGCGGMGIAFKNAGYEIAGAWDFDKYAVESYRANVGDHVQKADIKELHQADIPQADVWAFGFPCQDLSVAGKQRGMILKCEDCGEEIEINPEEYTGNTVCPKCSSNNFKAASRSGCFFEMMRLLEETEREGEEKQMAVRGFFYNSVNKDRLYNGQDMNEDKAPFYKEGVAYGHLQVTADGESMAVKVDGGSRTGYAYINLHTIHNTTVLELPVSGSNGTLPRIDRVILRNDETERKPSIFILEGAYSSNPQPPELTNNDTIQEKCLAEIYVAAGAVAISQSDITDTRADTGLCGFIASQFEDFDFSQFTKQFNAWFALEKKSMEQDHANFIEEYAEMTQAFMTDQEAQWNKWFKEKQTELSGDIAGKLQLQIDDVKEKVYNIAFKVYIISTLEQITSPVTVKLTNKTTGTMQTVTVTKSQMGFYVTEAGEYTVEADLESVMVTPKAFKVTNDNLMTTQNITLREGSNMGYIGNYIGSFIAQ